MQVNLSSLNNVCKPTGSKINRQQLKEHDLDMIKKSQHYTKFMFHLYLSD